LRNETQALATKIREDARFLADQEANAARQRVRQELADRAEAAARDLVQKNIAPPDHSRLAQEFIQNIGSAR
jgi:F0F1-type ATP synthase membrane subunit b/b'